MSILHRFNSDHLTDFLDQHTEEEENVPLTRLIAYVVFCIRHRHSSFQREEPPTPFSLQSYR